MASRRAEIRMTSDEVDMFLRSRYIATFGSIGPSGAPHLVSIGYVVGDDGIEFCSYSDAQKIVNLRRNPLASILVEHTLPYAEIKGVLVAGPARIHDDPDRAKAVMDALGAQMRVLSPDDVRPPVDTQVHSRRRVTVTMPLVDVRSWDHSRLGGRY
jgi:nitroimidazol reductase NimA-like FMN-containing flavoprotein (pyridoxamine 5'-phosphate oxidase superfamily)